MKSFWRTWKNWPAPGTRWIGRPDEEIVAATLGELRQVVDAIKSASGLKGVLSTSAKGVFIAGADIKEFGQYFKLSDDEMAAWLGLHDGVSVGERGDLAPALAST